MPEWTIYYERVFHAYPAKAKNIDCEIFLRLWNTLPEHIAAFDASRYLFNTLSEQGAKGKIKGHRR